MNKKFGCGCLFPLLFVLAVYLTSQDIFPIIFSVLLLVIIMICALVFLITI